MTQLHTQHVREITAMTSREAGVDHRERAHLPPGTVSGRHSIVRNKKNHKHHSQEALILYLEDEKVQRNGYLTMEAREKTALFTCHERCV